MKVNFKFLFLKGGFTTSEKNEIPIVSLILTFLFAVIWLIIQKAPYIFEHFTHLKWVNVIDGMTLSHAINFIFISLRFKTLLHFQFQLPICQYNFIRFVLFFIPVSLGVNV
jgi:hypothetical protein